MYWTNKFNEFNKKYWDGKLTKIPVKIRDLSADRAEGLYHYPDDENGTESYIEIDKKLTITRSLTSCCTKCAIMLLKFSMRKDLTTTMAKSGKKK